MEHNKIRSDQQYCIECGEVILKKAYICPKCGVRNTSSGTKEANEPVPKSKTVAVVLAILVGAFAWLYTYKRDAWKFWVSVGLTVVTLGYFGIAAWIWVIIDVIIKPTEFYTQYPNA